MNLADVYNEYYLLFVQVLLKFLAANSESIAGRIIDNLSPIQHGNTLKNWHYKKSKTHNFKRFYLKN